MSDPTLSDIDFKHEMSETTLNFSFELELSPDKPFLRNPPRKRKMIRLGKIN